MNYRELGKTGLMVGEIGIGCEGFVDHDGALAYYHDWLYQVVKVHLAQDWACIGGMDLYTPNPDMRTRLGKALRGRREKFVLQAHLCTVWKNGQY